MSHVDAAALALTGLTALCAIEDSLKLKSGETILIQGGAGGVASFAIQLANISAPASSPPPAPPISSYLRDIGADRGHRLQHHRLHQGREQLRCGVRYRGRRRGDAVVRGSQARRACSLYRIRTKAPTPERGDVIALRPAASRDRPHLERVAALYQAGVIRAPEVKLYKLSEAAEAHRVSEARHLRGKLVFKVR